MIAMTTAMKMNAIFNDTVRHTIRAMAYDTVSNYGFGLFTALRITAVLNRYVLDLRNLFFARRVSRKSIPNPAAIIKVVLFSQPIVPNCKEVAAKDTT